MNRKTTEIELFGKKLLLSERNASDVIALSKYAIENNEQTLDSVVYKAIKIIEASLVFNYIDLPWHKFFTRIKLQSLLKFRNLINKLPQSEIFSLAEKVLELEGLLVKKDSADEKKREQ